MAATYVSEDKHIHGIAEHRKCLFERSNALRQCGGSGSLNLNWYHEPLQIKYTSYGSRNLGIVDAVSKWKFDKQASRNRNKISTKSSETTKTWYSGFRKRMLMNNELISRQSTFIFRIQNLDWINHIIERLSTLRDHHVLNICPAR